MTWNSGPCLTSRAGREPSEGVLTLPSFGTRFDDRAGGTYWWVDLGDNKVASGYSETASEAQLLIADYHRAQTSELRFRGPRSVYGGDG